MTDQPQRGGSERMHTSSTVDPSQVQATAPSQPRTEAVELPFGASLEPILYKNCHGRLRNLSWFRTDWQRGGAVTGYGVYEDDDGRDQPVVVKVPVPPMERAWLVRLQDGDDVVPRLYAHGESLNGYDFAWLVMERLPFGPLGGQWQGREFELLADAAGRFYASASGVAPTSPTRPRDWIHNCELARKCVKKHGLPLEQRWNKALKKAQRKLDEWLKIWFDSPNDQWCHGDLHFGNALTRSQPPHGPALLIDFARTHVGCWVQDAVYFEHLFWARRDRLDDRKLCSMVAKKRKAYGLPVEAHWPELARVRRLLLAMVAPANFHLDGSVAHLEASLELLEAGVG